MIIDKLKEIGRIEDPQRRIFEVFQLADDELFPILGKISDRRLALRLLLNFVRDLPGDRAQGAFNTLLDDIDDAYREIIEALPEKERAEMPKRIG